MKIDLLTGYVELTFLGCDGSLNVPQLIHVSWMVEIFLRDHSCSVQVDNQTCASFWIKQTSPRAVHLLKSHQKIEIKFSGLSTHAKEQLFFQLWPQSRKELEQLLESSDSPDSSKWLELSPEAILMMTSYTEGDTQSILCRMARNAIEIGEWTCGDPADVE